MQVTQVFDYADRDSRLIAEARNALVREIFAMPILKSGNSMQRNASTPVNELDFFYLKSDLINPDYVNMLRRFLIRS